MPTEVANEGARQFAQTPRHGKFHFTHEDGHEVDPGGGWSMQFFCDDIGQVLGIDGAEH